MLGSTAFAQVPRKIVVEHFTNTVCGICAFRNPPFYVNLANQGDALHIAYHPSAPYSSCILNQHNVAGNDDRTLYYNTYGSTPDFFFQGVFTIGDVSLPTVFDPYEGMTSPATIRIVQTAIETDSINVRVVVETNSTHSLAPQRLYVALVEDTVFYNAPNGENEHYDVFRTALTPASGISAILPATVGDSLNLDVTVATRPDWDLDRMYAIAILQDATTKAVEQSEKTTLFRDGFPGANCIVDPDITDPEGDGAIFPLEWSPAYKCEGPWTQNVSVEVFPDTQILPLINCTVNTLTVNDLIGLPPGFTYGTNPASGIIAGGDRACALVSGDPAGVPNGTYDVLVAVTLDLSCPVIGPNVIEDTVDFGISVTVADCGDCATLDAPQNPISTIRPVTERVDLEWGPVVGAVGYRINGGPIPAAGNLPPQLGESNRTRSINFAALIEGATYRWSVRAGCGPTGPPLTALSVTDTFDGPSPLRVADIDAQLPSGNAFELYPNPASEYIILQYQTETAGEAQVTIFDAKGSAVMQKTAAVFEGSNMIKYNLDLEAGTYFMEVQQGAQISTRPLNISSSK